MLRYEIFPKLCCTFNLYMYKGLAQGEYPGMIKAFDHLWLHNRDKHKLFW